MATIETDLCNIALFRVGADEISDLDEQSYNAEKCRFLYPLSRDTTLSEGAWGFANATRALSLTGTTADEWDYVYDYPTDCLHADYIVPPGGTGNVSTGGITLRSMEFDPIPFKVILDTTGSKAIGTNYEDAILSYTKYVTSVLLFDPPFKEALCWKLAADLALPLGGDSGKKYRDQALAAYQQIIDKSVAFDANQQWPRKRQVRPAELRARAGSVYSHYHYDGRFYRRF